jgi:hypothetical protein
MPLCVQSHGRLGSDEAANGASPTFNAVLRTHNPGQEQVLAKGRFVEVCGTLMGDKLVPWGSCAGLPHPITSSARASISRGNVHPMLLAVVWFSVSAMRVGCSIGISPTGWPRST